MFKILLFLNIFHSLIIIIFSTNTFQNPLKNYNFTNGLENWYTETRGLLQIVEGTSKTSAIKMTRTDTSQPCPFIAQWPKWPINQKFTLGMRYKANLSKGGTVLFSCEGYKYIDTIYIYSNNINTGDQWYYQELDTQWTEFIEGSGLCAIGFRGSTTGTFILDEVFWKLAKVNIFSSLSINVWQSTVYDEDFEIRVALKIKDTIYENGTNININLTVYEKDTNKKMLFYDKYKIKRTHLTKYAEFIVNPSTLNPGFYYAKVEIYNTLVDVYETNERCTFRKSGERFTQEYLKKTRKIYIDNKLRTWINGKMTFPLGLYAELEYNKTHIDNFINSPFNMIFSGGSSWDMITDLYEKSNKRLYSIQYLWDSATYSYNDPIKMAEARQNGINVAKRFKQYEGLIGYYFVDEPGVQISFSMMNTTFGLREEDPDRFVFTAVNQRYNLNTIKEGLDVIGTDCYPATTSDALHCVSTVATEGIRNMANAKANWGIIQIYDKTVDGESGQNAPTELELRNMLYQVIAAGAMGLFAYNYASLWHPNVHNPAQSEWDKVVKIFKEFNDVYAKYVYYVDEPFREEYIFPEMIYSIPRGENVIARLWKNDKYDYILLVNMDKSKQIVNYNFKKPSPNTCIDIISGVKPEDIKMDNTTNVKVSISYIGVVWLRGYDSDSQCDKAKYFDEEENSNVVLISVTIVLSVVLVAGLVLVLYWRKKLCFEPGFNLKQSFRNFKDRKLLKGFY